MKKILGQRNKMVQKSEKKNISIIRKGIIASKIIKKFKIIKENDLQFARPANNFSYDEVYKLIGKKIKVRQNKGEIIKKKEIFN